MIKHPDRHQEPSPSSVNPGTQGGDDGGEQHLPGVRCDVLLLRYKAMFNPSLRQTVKHIRYVRDCAGSNSQLLEKSKRMRV